MYTGKYKENLDAIHDIVEISDIYDNTAYTIAKICNKLAEINNTFSFDVLSGTSFTFHFSINFKPEYLPILFTKSNKYKNMFTVDYLDRYFNYYAGGFDWWYSTFSQTIDFTTTADTVTITKRVYYADGSKDNSQVVFSPSKSPYILYCPATDDFTRTIAGQTASKNCPTGYTGSITRKCSESGVWEDEVTSCTLSVNNSEPSKSESVSEPSITVIEPSKNEPSESENNNYMIYIILIIIVVIIVIIIIIIIRVKSQSKKEINRFRLK